MSGAGQYGDAWYVERRYADGSSRRPLVGRASTPERAHQLAARYRAIGGEPGVIVEVTSKSGHAWAPWVWNDATGQWDRASKRVRTAPR